MEAKEAAGLAADFCLVAAVRGQLILTPASESLFERVTWDGDVAAQRRPHSDPKSPVRIDPELRFGRPSIRGISTSASTSTPTCWAWRRPSCHSGPTSRIPTIRGGIVHTRQRPACPIRSPATPDREWIPLVAAHGWLIIARDSHIEDRRADIAAVRDHGARMIALAGREATSTWASSRSSCVSGARSSAALRSPGPTSTPPPGPP